MLKALNPKLALIVGEKASIVFQHICYWMQTQKVSTVYRTNKELSSDLEGMFSEQQIQRAKKKLLDNGIITVSFDKKNVWNRTTHYTLTEKGKAYVLSLSLNNSDSSEVNGNVGNHKGSVETKPKSSSRLPKTHVSKAGLPDYGLMHNSQMKQSFDEGFVNENATKGIPAEALAILGKKVILIEQFNNDWESVVADEMSMYEDDEYKQDDSIGYSQDDYDECEKAMMNCFSNAPVNTNNREKQLTMSELIKKAFTNGVSDAQQKMYDMKNEMNYLGNEMNYFSEDY